MGGSGEGGERGARGRHKLNLLLLFVGRLVIESISKHKRKVVIIISM